MIADASIDSLLVDSVQMESNSELGELQSSVWISRSVGSLLASLLAGVAMDQWELSSEVKKVTKFDAESDLNL